MDAQRVFGGAKRSELDLLQVLGHELKLPLLHIAGTSQQLSSGAYTDIETKEQLTRLEISSQHMLQLIDSLLLAGKIESNQLQLALEPINLTSITHSVTMRLTPLAARYGRSLYVGQKGKSIAPAAAHRESFEQALYAVLDTVVRSSQSEVIELRMQQKQDIISLSICDDSHKIPKGAIEHALASLGRRSQLLKQLPGSSGLSLYIADIVARAQAGSFNVQYHRNKRVITFTFNASQQLHLPL